MQMLKNVSTYMYFVGFWTSLFFPQCYRKNCLRGLPYEKIRNAYSLARGYKSRFLVSLMVFMMKHHYF